MSKSNKDNIVYSLSKEEATMLKKPKYNAFQGGYGVHGKTKYSRVDNKKNLSKILEEYDY